MQSKLSVCGVSFALGLLQCKRVVVMGARRGTINQVRSRQDKLTKQELLPG